MEEIGGMLGVEPTYIPTDHQKVWGDNRKMIGKPQNNPTYAEYGLRFP